MDLDELWSRARAGTLVDMKTFTLLLALKERRPDLFGDAKAAADRSPDR
jgi:hypothetical protein